MPRESHEEVRFHTARVTSDRAFGPPARPNVRYTSNSDQTAKCREVPRPDSCTAAKQHLRSTMSSATKKKLTAYRQPTLSQSLDWITRSNLIGCSTGNYALQDFAQTRGSLPRKAGQVCSVGMSSLIAKTHGRRGAQRPS